MLFIIGAIALYALLTGNHAPTFGDMFKSGVKGFRWISGFASGFIFTGCIALLALPFIIATLCKLSLWVIGL